MRYVVVCFLFLLSLGCSLSTSISGEDAQAIPPGYDINNPSCADVASVPAHLYCTYVANLTNPILAGAGTRTNPYKICSPYQLNAIGADVNLLSSHFELQADLDMSCIVGNHTMIGTSATPFTGALNGNGNKISNWKYEDPAGDYVGLVGFTNGGSISNLTLENAVVTGRNWVGLIVGDSEGGHLLKLVTSGTATGNANVGGIAGRAELGAVNQSSSSATVNGVSAVGGLVGSGGTPQIVSSHFSGAVNATGDRAGGIMGNNTFGTVLNCYSTGTVTSTSTRAGGIIGGGGGGLRNSYSSGTVSGTTLVGGLIGDMTGTIYNSFSTATVSGRGGALANVGVIKGNNGTGTVNNSYYLTGAICDADSDTAGVQACNVTATGTHAAITAFHDTTLEPMASWDFQNETAKGTADVWALQTSDLPVAWYENPAVYTVPFTTGSGTVADPYYIANVGDWNNIGSNPRWMHAHFILGANLDFNAQTFKMVGAWESPFYGSLDGNSKSILNVTQSLPTQQYTGLFGITLNPAVIRDLTVTGSLMTGTTFSSLLSGASTAMFQRVAVSGVLNGGYHSGAIVGVMNQPGHITESTGNMALVAAAGAGSSGGLVGSMNSGLVELSSASGTMTGAQNYMGGLAGSFGNGIIRNSHSSVSVTGNTANYVGGLVGRALGSAYVENCYATGNINGRTYTGGIAGYLGAATVTVQNSFAVGNVTGNSGSTRVGRLFGDSIGVSTNNYYLSISTCDSQLAAGVQACNNNFSSGFGAVASYFHENANAPMSSWDFTAIWVENALAYPSLL